MRILKELLFPTLCHRCMEQCENFLCDRCLVGFELAEIEGGDKAAVFAHGLSFIYSKRKEYQEIIISCTIIQLSRLRWGFNTIYCEPELIYLKRALEKKLPRSGPIPLYLIHRKQDPILLEPIKKHSKILFI